MSTILSQARLLVKDRTGKSSCSALRSRPRLPTVKRFDKAAQGSRQRTLRDQRRADTYLPRSGLTGSRQRTLRDQRRAKAEP
jgi:hypothetical protein